VVGLKLGKKPEENQHRKTFRKAADVVKGLGGKTKGFALAVPLVATLFTGCLSPEECRTYNKTTIILNRETDGKIARFNELKHMPMPESFITESLIDFINETHALSAEGIPKNTKITRVPDYCPGGEAYALPGGGSAERGVYLRSYISFANVRIVFHEIGHLQPSGRGNEVVSQLNEYEQIFNGFAVFANQLECYEDTKNWAGYAYELERRVVRAGGGDYGVADEYDEANVYIAYKLIEHEGNFNALRQEIEQLKQDGKLPAAIKEKVRLYNDRPEGWGAGIALELRMSFFKELQRRFGRETALLYFDSHTYTFIPELYSTVSGLSGLNCALTSEIEFREADSTEGCMGKETIDNAYFCCLSTEEREGGDVEFQKWIVNASGYRCDGQNFDSPWHFHYFFDISSQIEIELDEPCR